MSRRESPPHPELVEGRGGPTKPSLRSELAARRAVFHATQPLSGLTLSTHHPRLDNSPGVVAGYWPFRSEIDPRPLMRRFAHAGWRVTLPVTPPKGVAAPLTFRLWDPAAAMTTHPLGMHEPHPTAEGARPAIVLVPLLAFDGQGHRLGYGAGHYDRTLEGLRASGRVRAIGLAFAGQQVERLPAEPHDQPLDAILTERGLLEFAKPAR